MLKFATVLTALSLTLISVAHAQTTKVQRLQNATPIQSVRNVICMQHCDISASQCMQPCGADGSCVARCRQELQACYAGCQ
jgi:hypothetical protein